MIYQIESFLLFIEERSEKSLFLRNSVPRLLVCYDWIELIMNGVEGKMISNQLARWLDLLLLKLARFWLHKEGGAGSPLESCRAIKFLLAALSLTRSRVVNASGMCTMENVGFVDFLWRPQKDYNLKIFLNLNSIQFRSFTKFKD